MGLMSVRISLKLLSCSLAKCKDAVAKDVTNFNLEDEAFKEHMNNKDHENH